MTEFQLSADSRFVSQEVAARWLRAFTAFIENPKVRVCTCVSWCACMCVSLCVSSLCLCVSVCVSMSFCVCHVCSVMLCDSVGDDHSCVCM